MKMRRSDIKYFILTLLICAGGSYGIYHFGSKKKNMPSCDEAIDPHLIPLISEFENLFWNLDSAKYIELTSGKPLYQMNSTKFLHKHLDLKVVGLSVGVVQKDGVNYDFEYPNTTKGSPYVADPIDFMQCYRYLDERKKYAMINLKYGDFFAPVSVYNPDADTLIRKNFTKDEARQLPATTESVKTRGYHLVYHSWGKKESLVFSFVFREVSPDE